MAIEFKNNLDFNQNQAITMVLENQDTAGEPATGIQGQLYFNTTDQVVKVWNTTGSASWKSISGDITEVESTTTSQLVITNGTGPVASLAIQIGAIADGNLNLVTSDVIYDYIETLDPVLSVTGGLGITLTGTSDNVTVNVDYDGSAGGSIIEDATDGTGVALATDDTIIFQDSSDSIVKFAELSQLNTSSFHPTLAQVLSKGNTTGGTDLAVSAGDDITFTSTSKAIFNSQLEIYGDNSNSYIDDVGTGNLYVRSGAIRLQSTGGENMIYAIADAGVNIYYNNSKKFETTTDGVKITGGLQDKDDSLGTNGQYLTSTGTEIDWATLPTYDNYQYWRATDDAANTYDVTTTATFDFDAGAGITAVVGAGAVVITNTDLGSDQTFFKTVTCDTSSITATANDDTAIITGAANEIKTSGSSKTITLSLADGSYAAWGTSGTNLQLPDGATAKTQSSGDDTTKIATTAFVQAAMTGLLEFKGGFDADDGAIVGGGNLTDGGSRVAIAVGDYYVVTGDGDFYGNASTPLTTGDSVICQTLAAAGTSVEADWIVVQSDTDLATASTVGIGNVVPQTGTVTDYIPDSITAAYNAGTATLGVREASATQAGGQIVAASTPLVATYTGSGASRTVTLTYDTSANPNTASVVLNSSLAYVTRSYSAGYTTWTITVTNANVFDGGSGITTSAEVMTAAGQTVYCDITRSGATISFIFSGDISNSTYTVLLTRIS